jgi:hypothetical protein
MLGEACGSDRDGSGARKIGSFLKDISRSAGGEVVSLGFEGVTGAAGLEAGVDGTALKNCVKLPSADAESETPGAEKPLARDGLATGGVARLTSSAGFAGGGGSGVDPATKMRVNSPGSLSNGRFAGPPDSMGRLSAGTSCARFDGFTSRRGSSFWNIRVNSPGSVPLVPDCAGVREGAACDGVTGESPGTALLLSGADPDLGSKARRNRPVALSDSGSSWASGPDFGSFLVMGEWAFSLPAGFIAKITRTPPRRKVR